MAINTFLESGGSWSNTANWSLGTIPSDNQDIIVFTSSSGDCVLDIHATCSNINFNDYIGTFSFSSNTLLVYGDATFGNLMNFTYSSTSLFSGFNLLICTSSTITSNGMTVGVPVCLYNAGRNNTYNISQKFVTTERFGFGASWSGYVHTVNGSPIYTYGSLYTNNVGTNGTGSYITGNSKIYMMGVGSIRTSSLVRPNTDGATFTGIGIDIEIDSNSTLQTTTPINNIYFNNCTLTINGTTSYSGITNSYYSIYSGGNFTFSAPSCTSSSVLPVKIGNLALTGVSYSIDLNSDVYVSEISSLGLILRNNKAYTYGTVSNLTDPALGTTEIVIAGTNSDSISTLYSDANYISNNITIDTLGTVIFRNPMISSSVINIISGSISSSGLRVRLENNPIIYSNVFIPDITFYTTGSITLLSQLNFTNLTINDDTDVMFLGTYSWATDNFYFINGLPPDGRLGCGLSPNLTYIIRNSMTCYPSENYSYKIFSFRSLSPGTYSKLAMLGSSQKNISITGNDIDSSDGNMIRIFNYNAGTQSVNVLNWGDIKAAYMEKINISLT